MASLRTALASMLPGPLMKCVDFVTLPPASLPHVGQTCTLCASTFFTTLLSLLYFFVLCTCQAESEAVGQVVRLLNKSQALLNSDRPRQNGQSMRTLAGAIFELEAHGDSKQQPEMHFAYLCLAKHIIQSVHVLTSSDNWM